MKLVDQRGRRGLPELCYDAAGGDPYLALWLAVAYLGLYERRCREVRAA